MATKLEEKKTSPKSNLELIAANDNFPYQSTDPEAYNDIVSKAYRFCIEGKDAYTLGYMLQATVDELKKANYSEYLTITDKGKYSLGTVVLRGSNAQERSKNMKELLREIGPQLEVENGVDIKVENAPKKPLFKLLNGWRGEEYPIFGKGGEVLFKMERAATPLFGVVTYGSHLTGYYLEDGDGSFKERIRIWVGKRAKHKQTYPEMLDNTVGGGIQLMQTPLECIIAEANEEASLDGEYVRNNVKAAGVVTYYHIRGEAKQGEEQGLLQPEVQYVYDVELPEDQEPKPNDKEVESFTPMTVAGIKQELKDGNFKPNCASVILDFFIRHGLLTQADDPDYEELVARLHRRHEFPTRRGTVPPELRIKASK